MEWLNYHHLLYFWVVARAGSIARASQELHLSQPTISSQLKTLEASLGHPLFERRGRGLVLTDVGRTVQRFADDIFRTGRELQQALQGAPSPGRLPLVVGVADVIPKLLAVRMLAPAMEATEEIRLTCREGPLESLLGALALHEVDVVLSDRPAPESVRVKAFGHLLCESGLSFLAAPALASLRRGFPGSLDGAPVLLPTPGATSRAAIEAWFSARKISPVLAGEFDDGALLKAFGARGLGVFAAPTLVEKEVCAQYGVVTLGRTEEVQDRFYAITVERRLRHPGVIAVAEAARRLGVTRPAAPPPTAPEAPPRRAPAARPLPAAPPPARSRPPVGGSSRPAAPARPSRR